MTFLERKKKLFCPSFFSKKFQKCFLLFLIIIICFLSFLGGFVFHLYIKEKKLSALQQKLIVLSRETPQTVSFFIKDLSYFSRPLVFNSERKFPAASLIKLPLVAVAFKAVEEGKVSFSDSVTIKQKDLAGGSGILRRRKKFPLVLSFKELCRLSIAYSDNTATNKIIEILGIDYINTTFKKFGLQSTSLTRKMMDFVARRKGKENYTTADDIGYLLERIYKNSLLSRSSSSLLLSFLQEQKINDRLPRWLPEEAVVAHKTGLERNVVHDAGIVFTPHRDYIICVLVGNVNSYKRAKNFIAKISYLTYNLYR